MTHVAYISYMRTGRFFKWVVLLVGLLGCHREVPVPAPVKGLQARPGRFVLVLQGAFTDTLEGKALLRRDTSGLLVIDLIGLPDTSRGLSLEFPLEAPDTLEAVRRRITGPEPKAFVVGYLAWPPYTFLTEAGELVLRDRGQADRLTGTFYLALGALDPRTGEPLELEALGAFSAKSW